MNKSQDSLAGRLRAGDRLAAAELVDSYHKQIYLFMRRFGYDCHDSEDLTQECFICAWQRIGQLKNDRVVESWLYGIAANVSRLHWRKRKKVVNTVNVEEFDVAGEGEDVGDVLVYLEQVNKLKELIENLSIKLKQAVILHYMQQLTIVEAAGAVGVGEGTFKSRLNRALKKLRKQMVFEGEEK